VWWRRGEIDRRGIVSHFGDTGSDVADDSPAFGIDCARGCTLGGIAGPVHDDAACFDSGTGNRLLSIACRQRAGTNRYGAAGDLGFVGRDRSSPGNLDRGYALQEWVGRGPGICRPMAGVLDRA
jgi:hypothetical protein